MHKPFHHAGQILALFYFANSTFFCNFTSFRLSPGVVSGTERFNYVPTVMEIKQHTEENQPYIFELPLKVRDYEVDSQGIVNNANYLHYLEHTRHEFCESRGLTFREMQERGIDPVVNRIEIDYHTPLRLGESMTSRLWIERKGPRFIFHQDIFTPTGQLAVSALVCVVALEHGRPTRGDSLAEALSV